MNKSNHSPQSTQRSRAATKTNITTKNTKNETRLICFVKIQIASLLSFLRKQESSDSAYYGLPLPDQVEDKFRGSNSIYAFYEDIKLC